MPYYLTPKQDDFNRAFSLFSCLGCGLMYQSYDG